MRDIKTRIERDGGENILWVSEGDGMEIGIPQSSPMWGEVGADRFIGQTPQESGAKGPSDFALDEATRKARVNALQRFYADNPSEEGYQSVEQLTPYAGGADLGSDVPLFKAVESLAARVVQGGRKLSHTPLEGGMDG